MLLLDEPTNHLDVEGIAWLAEHLKRRWLASAGGLLVVTHDRWFLDEVCTADLGGARPDRRAVRGRLRRLRPAARRAGPADRLRRGEAAEPRAQGAGLAPPGPASRTSKPKFRIDAANALIADVPEIRDKVSLQSLAVARLGKDVVDLLGASAGYDGTEVLHSVEWRIAPGERTGILGVNGAGKSTLLGLITGAVKPDRRHGQARQDGQGRGAQPSGSATSRST